VIEEATKGELTTKVEEPNSLVSSEVRSEPPVLEPANWVENYGDVLFGFAAARVRDRAIAQDLVQETFLAALKAREGFRGRSSERAWLFGILRNKLVDYYRLQSREVALGDDEMVLSEEQVAFHTDGLRKGSWDPRLAPKAWKTPDKSLSEKEFQSVLKNCLSRLPERIANAFVMREMDGASTGQICNDLGVSANNVCVMLHRARMNLRRCLEIHWFGKKANNEQQRKAETNKEDKAC